MEKQVPESELLLPYEQRVLPKNFRDYFTIKRQCWLATIQKFSPLWNLFVELDEIFLREIEDCSNRPDLVKILPLLLFIKTHLNARVAAEVVFSTHLTHAYDLTRSAAETASIAHKIYREPKLAEVFLRRDDGKKELEAYKNAFERYKRQNLFPNRFTFLTQLHEIYSRFSDWGTHTTIVSMAQHLRFASDKERIELKIAYTEADPQRIALAVYDILSAFACIEKVFHDVFSGRLMLDLQLQKMRQRFASHAQNIAASLIKKYNIKQPRIIFP